MAIFEIEGKTGLRNFIKTSLLLVILNLSLSQPCSATIVSDGMEHYRKGNYAAAKIEFEKALKTNPEDPRLHYCLANSLLQLGKVPEAMREYHVCIHYGSGTILAEHSQKALDTYEKHATPFDHEIAQQKQRELDAQREAEKRDRAKSLIRDQGDLQSRIRSSESQANSKAILDRAEADAKRIREEANEAADGYKYFIRRRYGRFYDQQAKDIRKQAEEDSNALLKKAKSQSEGYEKEQSERQARMREAVENLNTQMETSSGKVRINPEGTSLYIRNYR
ncbi:MAG: tetratricopeptide repeat protein [Leptolyngbya sp.]|nr:tetratricopeptide repeat protein [Candidatus Melainabacteria bacterium]